VVYRKEKTRDFEVEFVDRGVEGGSLRQINAVAILGEGILAGILVQATSYLMISYNEIE
jgi:hypothetical protein